MNSSTTKASPKLAIVRDFREEGWPSMDLVADMLLAQLRRNPSGFQIEEIAPTFQKVVGGLPIIGSSGTARNFDRLWNRFVTLKGAVGRAAKHCNAFHIVDHSHAHLVHALPSERTGVYCHDLDTFRCLLDPKSEPRPIWFQSMARRILAGLQKAAIVFYNSDGTRDDLLKHGLVESSRLRHLPLGVAPEFALGPVDGSDPDVLRPYGLDGARYLLHVGSCIPRKRIDFLLQVFATMRALQPNLLLAKAGDPWTEAQSREIETLRLGPAIRHLGRLSQLQLIDVVRGAATVVIPSEAEGFGLPVIEALACGVPVVASDLASLREAGGDVARYAPVADLDRWTTALAASMAAPRDPAERVRRREWTAQFTWERHARIVAEAYRELLAGGTPESTGRDAVG